MTSETNRDPAQRFWTHVRWRALVPYVLVCAVLIAAVVIFGREIGRHIAGIEGWIEALGAWGVIVFIGFFVVLSSLLLPDTVLAIIAGAVFGPATGIMAVVTGTVAAAAIQYFLARHLLRERIARILSTRPSLQAVQRAVLREQRRLQFLLRLTPLNPATISYVLGAAGVRFGTFMAACAALVPNLFLEVYFGYAGKHMATMAGGNRWTVAAHDAAVIGGLIVCIVLMIVVSRTARKAVQEAIG